MSAINSVTEMMIISSASKLLGLAPSSGSWAAASRQRA